ncbi:MAG: alginate O-acetyltransferase [Epulopiscium sp. Nele67-Bin005]|nr:MAG: alginate O-acetyltransferase [Epulopiscium sp. Nele67-Bin005]
MIFSSISFIFLYLPIVFIIYMLLPNLQLKNKFLMIASLLFYAWGEPIYIFLMLILVFINWRYGIKIHENRHLRTQFVKEAVIINIGLLFIFKYMGFCVEVINSILSTQLPVPDLRLPIGISFFTFQALSYIIDVKREDAEVQKSYFDLLLYITLFPQLIAGPIVKYHDISIQLNERTITTDKIAKGIRRFIIGLTKKVVIANNMGLIADTIFSSNLTELNFVSAWIGAIAYVFQIYFDFSGYTDMAIGIGGMFGFMIKENFNYPLMATSIKEFWRRWHISLSTWFREYLYIPLGGNREGARRTYINQFIVFLATGLWHGANFTFIVWGLMHGLFLVLETTGIIKIDKIKNNFIKRIYTLLIVTLLFVLFRADTLTYGIGYIGVMFFEFDMANSVVGLNFMTPYIITIFIIAFIASTDILKRVQVILTKSDYFLFLHKDFWERSTYIVTFGLYIYNILILASNAYNPFIYFQF